MNYCKSIYKRFSPYLREVPVTGGTSFIFLINKVRCSPFWDEVESFGAKLNMTEEEAEKVFNSWLIFSVKKNITSKGYISTYEA